MGFLGSSRRGMVAKVVFLLVWGLQLIGGRLFLSELSESMEGFWVCFRGEKGIMGLYYLLGICVECLSG